MLSRSKRGQSRLNRPTTAPNIDLFTDRWRRCLATITIHELLGLDSLLSRSTVGYASDSVASRVLELQIGYVLHMLSTAAGLEFHGDTNASFRISRLPISIFQWISIFGDFQAVYDLASRTLTSLAVVVSFLHRCAVDITDWRTKFVPVRGIKGIPPRDHWINSSEGDADV